MEFKFHIGTRVVFGRNCVKNNKVEFGRYGKRALVVTGRNSGRSSGALDDVMFVMDELNIEYLVFDRVENNPTLENVNEGSLAARSFNADFIVGIGGGSPLDAAKAIAVLAVNNMEPVELYKNSFPNKPLPIIAIPTTAGTGSEVTPYSILTRHDMHTKMSFGNEDTFPMVAFLDAAYTEKLPYEVTVNTAVDAFTHALEGYLNKRSTPVSDIFAAQAIEIFGKCVDSLEKNKLDFDIREKLLYMSMLGGMVISHTGTTIAHGMGYSLTYFKDIPHGKANGLLIREYLKFNYAMAREKIENVLRLLKVKDIEGFGNIMHNLLGTGVNLSEDEVVMYASMAIKQKSALYNIRTVTEEDMQEIYRKSLNGC